MHETAHIAWRSRIYAGSELLIHLDMKLHRCIRIGKQ